MKNKCTLLVDGNWLLMSRMWVVKDYFSVQNDDSENLRAKNELKELLARSITTTLQKFDKVVDNIVIITDGGSWRKKLEKPKTRTQNIYKGNRVSDSALNWSLIWETLQEFFDNCASIGITVSRVSDMEGDDLVYYWSRKLNSEGINCIIWSSDQDLQQLVQYRDCVFTAWYENKKGLCLPETLKEKTVDPIEFFMTMETCGSSVLDILKKEFLVFYINPDDIVMKKVICGDDGDNILSIIREKKGNKTYKIGKKMWESMQDKMGIKTIREFIKKKDDICNRLCIEKNYSDVDAVKNEFDYNVKLVWLSSEIIPEELIKKADEINYSIYEISNIKNNFKILSGDTEEEDAMKVFENMDLPF